jgi:hypothetical protein
MKRFILAYQLADSRHHDPFCRILNMELLQFYDRQDRPAWHLCGVRFGSASIWHGVPERKISKGVIDLNSSQNISKLVGSGARQPTGRESLIRLLFQLFSIVSKEQQQRVPELINFGMQATASRSVPSLREKPDTDPRSKEACYNRPFRDHVFE